MIRFIYFAIILLLTTPAFGEKTLLPHDTYTYKNVDGLDVQADVYGGDPDNPKPVLVFIHGGALISGSRNQIRNNHCQAYLDAGFVVVSIDYRLAPEVKLPQIAEDLSDAFEWIRREGLTLFGADPTRISVVGQSAGGYLTLLAGHYITPRPKALVSFYGYGDIIGRWYSQPDPFYCKQPTVSEDASGKHVNTPIVANRSFSGTPKDLFYLWCRQQGRWPIEVGGVDSATNPGFFTPYSPLLNVDAAYPPTLLLHGDKDTDVPYAQSVMMVEALKKAEVEHTLITIKGGGHVFDGHQNDPQVQAAFQQVMSFLHKHGK